MSNGFDVLPERFLTWAEVDLQGVRHNAAQIARRLNRDTKFFAVIKADAYGHGAVAVAQALADSGISMFCVARVEEALELRDYGIAGPILVMGPPLEAQARVAVEAELDIVICGEKHLAWMKAAAQAAGKNCRVHLNVDFGMGRLGCLPGDAPGLARQIAGLGPEVEFAGVMSHFPCADCEGDPSTEIMIRNFAGLREEIRGLGIPVPPFHISNTAGLLRFPGAQFDAVRSGIALYGQYPSVSMERNADLIPAMTLKSRVVFLKEVGAGTPISYGGTYVTSRRTRLATIPMGYADGFPRAASNRSEMIVRGQLARQIGRVCMDLLVLDVTDIPGVEVGNEVVAFGRSESLILAAEDVAARYDSLGYELTTRLGKRVPRVYGK